MATASEREELIVRALSIFERYEAEDYAGAAANVTTDVVLRFGNAEPIVGRDAYLAGLENIATHMGSLRHDVLNHFWIDDNSALGFEMNVHYVLLDGSELDLPVFNVFRFRDGLVSEYQVFMDIAPVVAGYDRAFLEPATQTAQASAKWDYNDVADRFTEALQASDADALAEVYTDDAKFWHSADGKTMEVGELLELARGLGRSVASCTITIENRLPTPNGFVQTHTSHYEFRGGEQVALQAALLVTVEDSGLISRIDEYLDSATLAALVDAIQQAA